MPKENDDTNTEHSKKACEWDLNMWPQYSLCLILCSYIIKGKEKIEKRNKTPQTTG